MVTTILLVRHAVHAEFGRVLSGRRPDVALSSDGPAQAQALSARLAKARLTAVYSSPSERTYRTAQAIAGQHGVRVNIEPLVQEIDFGSWEGRGFAELDTDADPAWQRWNECRSSARAPGGESMVEAIMRAENGVKKIARSHPDGTVAVVSHCDIIRGVLGSCLGMPIDNLLRFDVDPASVSRIAHDGNRVRVISINERPAE